MDKDINTNIRTLEKNNSIGIMGGTFDPVHYGHLFIAQTAMDRLDLDKILFVPTGRPPHKEEELITDADRRIDMLELAIKTNPGFDISTIEVARERTCYTIDTIKELQQCYTDEIKFYFIVGSDAFTDIESWKEYKKLLGLIEFIVMTRQISKNRLLDDKIKLFTKKYSANIIKIEIPFLDISSTDIRQRIKKGMSIKYLLPESVEKYIYSNKLYKN